MPRCSIAGPIGPQQIDYVGGASALDPLWRTRVEALGTKAVRLEAGGLCADPADREMCPGVWEVVTES